MLLPESQTAEWLNNAGRVVLVVGLFGVGGWLVWWFDRDEAAQSRIGIEAKEWQRGKAELRKHYDPRPEIWKRAERRLFGLGRLGTRVYTKGAKR